MSASSPSSSSVGWEGRGISSKSLVRASRSQLLIRSSSPNQPPLSGLFFFSFLFLENHKRMADMGPVFSCFVFYGVLLVIKMYIIAIITGQVRLRKKVSGFWGGGLFCSITSSTGANFWRMPITCCSLKGICQPGGRAQTRRAAVPQRRSVRGEMPEVKIEEEKNVSQLAFNLQRETRN